MPLREVVIGVGDLEEGIAFYTEACGLRFVRTVRVDGRRVAELDADGQRVTLIPSDGGVSLVLPSDDVRAARRRLRRRGVGGVPDDPTEVDGGAWLPFTDPWGNQLGFWQDT